MKKYILASASPRRRELLELLNIDFDVMPSDCDEICDKEDPAELVMSLAEQKCMNVAAKISDKCSENIIIGSDTIVCYENKVLGKPKSEQAAFDMLRMLSGKTHVVYTGVCIYNTLTGSKKVFEEHTFVTMYDVSDEEILDYIATGDPMDKAGAYGIQSKGIFLVKEIKGDYSTVVGLPAARLGRELKCL